MQFIGVSKSNGRIVEYNRVGASIPTSNPTIDYIEVSEAQNQEILQQINALSSEGRVPEVFYDGVLGVHSKPDTRPIFEVVINTNNTDLYYAATNETLDYIYADGVDTATVNIRTVDETGGTLPFTGKRAVDFFDNRIAFIDYINGFATKQFKTTKSGLFTLKSTPEYRLTGEVKILCVEA